MENVILRISTSPSCLFEYWSTDPEYLDKNFRHLKECGFEAIDFSMGHFIQGDIKTGEIDDFWNKSLEELYEFFALIKNAAEDNGIGFVQAHASFPLFVEGNDKVNDYMRITMEKSIAVCAFVGCPAVVAHPITHTDKEKEIEINLEMYRKMIPAAKKYGVKVCLENMFIRPSGKPMEAACSTAEESCYYIDTLNEEAGEEVFGYCFDVGHANLLGRDIKSFITKLDKRLTCLHIQDCDGNYDSHMIPYTQIQEGSKPRTDWEGMIEGLKEINYQGAVNFETFRNFRILPKEVETEALKLLSAIGRYFRNRITEE